VAAERHEAPPALPSNRQAVSADFGFVLGIAFVVFHIAFVVLHFAFVWFGSRFVAV
jgi:hypothetical protein